ncbi:hypothetical protein M407DRAFT_10835 [Tulasnella calospora MUT 4182]|uniref:Uncharacterized protein n=1 Tax=Tulasnella calospora MUT 4182 TaxID=1051891 RepID=A0A0C3LGH9_9AGAM|nr:hypothetical protein M407DRAFT_10835 [Tulasnella calospora MUT 4182]
MPPPKNVGWFQIGRHSAQANKWTSPSEIAQLFLYDNNIQRSDSFMTTFPLQSRNEADLKCYDLWMSYKIVISRESPRPHSKWRQAFSVPHLQLSGSDLVPIQRSAQEDDGHVPSYDRRKAEDWSRRSGHESSSQVVAAEPNLQRKGATVQRSSGFGLARNLEDDLLFDMAWSDIQLEDAASDVRLPPEQLFYPASPAPTLQQSPEPHRKPVHIVDVRELYGTVSQRDVVFVERSVNMPLREVCIRVRIQEMRINFLADFLLGG